MYYLTLYVIDIKIEVKNIIVNIKFTRKYYIYIIFIFISNV